MKHVLVEWKGTAYLINFDELPLLDRLKHEFAFEMVGGISRE
jgi:hypothetical protein